MNNKKASMDQENKENIYVITLTWIHKKQRDKMKKFNNFINNILKKSSDSQLQALAKDARDQVDSAKEDLEQNRVLTNFGPLPRTIGVDTAMLNVTNQQPFPYKPYGEDQYIYFMINLRNDSLDLDQMQSNIEQLKLTDKKRASIKRKMLDKAVKDYKKEYLKQKKAENKATCEANGKMWLASKNKCVNKDYHSRVVCKKTKGNVYAKFVDKNGIEYRKCVASAKKRSAMCRKKGMVYDKTTNKCRKSSVKKSRSRKQVSTDCQAKGYNHVGKSKKTGRYVCRKTPVKKRSLSKRKADCQRKKSRVFSKSKKTGKWGCRKRKRS